MDFVRSSLLLYLFVLRSFLTVIFAPGETYYSYFAKPSSRVSFLNHAVGIFFVCVLKRVRSEASSCEYERPKIFSFSCLLYLLGSAVYVHMYL